MHAIALQSHMNQWLASWFNTNIGKTFPMPRCLWDEVVQRCSATAIQTVFTSLQALSRVSDSCHQIAAVWTIQNVICLMYLSHALETRRRALAD